jgi:hypothetical protein
MLNNRRTRVTLLVLSILGVIVFGVAYQVIASNGGGGGHVMASY